MSDNKPLFILFLLSVTIFVASLFHREITYDDAFFAEQAYWANKNGYVRSELFNNYMDWGERQYIYLKLHVWQTAIVARVAGWSPYFFKSAPLFYLFVFIYFSFVYYKHYLSPNGYESFYLFLVLLLLNTYVVHLGFENRPEIMQMCLGFISFLSIRHGIQFTKPSYIILAGLLSGISVLFHFNGIIYITAGSVLIIYMRYSRYLIYFLIAAGLIAPIYWYEMIANQAIETGINQMLNYPSLSRESSSLKYILLKLFSAPARYVKHLFDFSYFLLLILSLYFYRHTLKTNTEIKILLVYLVAAEVTLAIIAPGGKAAYLVLHLPFALFIITVLNKDLFSRPLHRRMIFAFILYAITHTGHIVSLIADHNSHIISQHANIIEKYQIQKTDKILAPAVFVFNEIANAKITATENLNGGLIQNNISTSKEYFQQAFKQNYQYLILNNDFLSRFNTSEPHLGQTLFRYKLVGIEFGYYIFQKLE